MLLNRRLYFLLSLTVLLLVTGCSSVVVSPDQLTITQTISLQEKQSVGQTFVAKYNGLAGVQVYVDPKGSSTEGNLVLSLKDSPSGAVLAQSALPVSTIDHPGYYPFSFPPLSTSNQKSYYFYLELSAPNRVEFSFGPGNSYLDGSFYIDHRAEDGQLAFKPVYDRLLMIQGMITEGLGWAGILLASGLLFILPGWALLSSLWMRWDERDWIEKTALAAGCGLAIYPILFLITYLVHIQIGLILAWAPGVLSGLFLIWKNRKVKRQAVRIDWCSSNFWGQLSALTVIGLVIFVRFVSVRELNVPLWGDSYHHTMIAQLIVDNNGLFDSWAPYADLESLTYHFGFHTLVAVFSWVTRLPVVQSTIWIGQLLNILAVFTLYPLSRKVGRSAWAGSLALLIAGMVSTYPMFYTNWGRYTQLSGQSILPVAVWLLWDLTENHEQSLRAWMLTGLIWAAVALTHYRIFMIGLPILLILFFENIRKKIQWPFLKGYLVAGLTGLLVVLPWFLHTYLGTLMNLTFRSLSSGEPAEQSSTVIEPLATYQPVYLWILLLIAVVCLIWLHEKRGLFVTGWLGLALVATNPNWFGLPGGNIITNFALFIMVYIWTSILIGAGFGILIEKVRLPVKFLIPLQAGLFLAILLIGIGNVEMQRSYIHAVDSQMVTKADEKAFEWINANTAADSRFLVNFMMAYKNTVVVGTDAGWWLPLLAHRQNTVPPMPYDYEKSNMPDYKKWVNFLPSEIVKKGVLAPDVIQLLRQRGIDYVYIGQRQGRINSTTPDILAPDLFRSSPNFKPVYHQDRVWIFQLQP